MTKHILVTNDDGVFAPGLLALTQETRRLGKLSILAPDRNWSGGGHVKTLDRALRVYHSRLDERTDPHSKPYYWIGGDAPTGVPERGTDVAALAEGFVSLTPLQHYLTAYRALTDLNTRHWDESSLETTLLEASQEVFVSQ